MAYTLKILGADLCERERINLVDTATKVTLNINGVKFETYTIKVSTGASEDEDLFNF